ncbi:MAG TPA: ferric iron uptake transcriptional regulator [Thiothrix sp.]|nr:ferric iron uptake transcriptional regulator [Thiothrix sp.]
MKKQDLKEAGLKVTQPRMKILALMEQSDKRHLSAEEVYKKLLESNEEIGLATVYRVLTQFESAGLVCRHNFEGNQAVFELTGEDDEHHDHMVCIKTGKVIEFYDDIIEQRQIEIAKQHGFKITDHTLVLYGEFTASPEA